MGREWFGGNEVTHLSKVDGVHAFASSPYVYRMLQFSDGDRLTDSGLLSRTVLVQAVDPGASLEIVGFPEQLGLRDSYQLEGHDQIEMVAHGGAVTVLVVGVASVVFAEPSATLTRADDAYTVTKPWGHEVWFCGEHPAYCLKEVFLKGGQRTSLQYHNFKRETNVLFSGSIALIYKANDSITSDNATADDLGREELTPLSVIDVVPHILHRIESLSDVLLYEASTPHLDDVIRVQDDKARGDGRIQSEHKP